MWTKTRRSISMYILWKVANNNFNFTIKSKTRCVCVCAYNEEKKRCVQVLRTGASRKLINAPVRRISTHFSIGSFRFYDWIQINIDIYFQTMLVNTLDLPSIHQKTNLYLLVDKYRLSISISMKAHHQFHNQIVIEHQLNKIFKV